MSNKDIKEYVFVAIILGVCVLIASIMDIRICLVYNVFGIPCVGCGLTRSVVSLFNGHLITSLKYNILGLPICILFLISIVWIIIDKIKNKETFNNFIKHNMIIILLISIFIVLVTWWINLNNPMLY